MAMLIVILVPVATMANSELPNVKKMNMANLKVIVSCVRWVAQHMTIAQVLKMER